MPFAINALDGHRVYFEDDAGNGPPIVFLNGLGDPVAASRRWGVSAALAADHRCVYVDQRGHGLSAKPHDPAAYTTRLRVADVVAVLDELGIERAHIVGASWGARLAFGIGKHAPQRALSMTMGGQTPYAMNPQTAGVKLVTQAFASGNSMADFMAALGGFEELDNEGYREVLDNDFDALAAAWSAAMAEGDVASDLRRWAIPCLVYAGTNDIDFYDGAKLAASIIPGARFVALEGLNHLEAHANVDNVLPHVKKLLAETGASSRRWRA
jgi:pimeloyl-ACP methyl ester carboxylesterase